MVFSMAEMLLWQINMLFLVVHPILSQTCNGGLSFQFGGSKPPSFSLELQRGSTKWPSSNCCQSLRFVGPTRRMEKHHWYMVLMRLAAMCEIVY